MINTITGHSEGAERGSEAFRRGVEILHEAETYLYRSRTGAEGEARALADMHFIPAPMCLSLTDIADALSVIAPLYEEAGFPEDAQRAAKNIEKLSGPWGSFFKQYDYMSIAKDDTQKVRRSKRKYGEVLPKHRESLRTGRPFKIEGHTWLQDQERQIRAAIEEGNLEAARDIARSSNEGAYFLEQYAEQYAAIHFTKNDQLKGALAAASGIAIDGHYHEREETLQEVLRLVLVRKDSQKYGHAEEVIRAFEDAVRDKRRNTREHSSVSIRGEDGQYRHSSEVAKLRGITEEEVLAEVDAEDQVREIHASESYYVDYAVRSIATQACEEGDITRAKEWAHRIRHLGQQAMMLGEIAGDELLRDKDYELTLTEALRIADDPQDRIREPLNIAFTKVDIARSMIRAGKLSIARTAETKLQTADQKRRAAERVQQVLLPVRHALIETLQHWNID